MANAVATIVAVDCSDGVLLAGDRVVVRGGRVVGSRRHVFAFDDSGAGIGAAAVGEDPNDFHRRLDVALREYASERGEPTVDAVARMAADVAAEPGVEVLVAARDGSGTARVRSVSEGVHEERTAAFGSGASTVGGHLEAIGEVDLDVAGSEVRAAFQAAAARDPGTGEELDVWRLADEEG